QGLAAVGEERAPAVLQGSDDPMRAGVEDLGRSSLRVGEEQCRAVGGVMEPRAEELASEEATAPVVHGCTDLASGARVEEQQLARTRRHGQRSTIWAPPDRPR